MDWIQVMAMLVWTGAGAVLLTVLMWLDALFTKYNDIQEIKNGNVAVTTRFVMKLFAQGYILSQSMLNSRDLDWLVESLGAYLAIHYAVACTTKERYPKQRKLLAAGGPLYQVGRWNQSVHASL